MGGRQAKGEIADKCGYRKRQCHHLLISTSHFVDEGEETTLMVKACSMHMRIYEYEDNAIILPAPYETCFVFNPRLEVQC